MVTGGYRGLHRVTRVYQGLDGVRGDCKRLQRVTRTYSWLQGVQGVTRSYRGLQDVT